MVVVVGDFSVGVIVVVMMIVILLVMVIVMLVVVVVVEGVGHDGGAGHLTSEAREKSGMDCPAEDH